MIRRDDGTDWLIIPQTEHARVAAELARAWGSERFPPLAIQAADRGSTATLPMGIDAPTWLRARTAFDTAIAHHDDGWSTWDCAPRVDAETGLPRDFLEMRLSDSTAIWTRSINALRENKRPLSASVVSGHFCFLSERARERFAESAQRTSRLSDRDADDSRAACRFLDEQQALRSSLEGDAEAAGTADDLRRFADIGYRTVQFFDRLSLWLCCAERSQPVSFAVPTGGDVMLTPSPESPRNIQIEPHPFAAKSITLETPVKRIPVRKFGSDLELQSVYASAQTERLAWNLGRV